MIVIHLDGRGCFKVFRHSRDMYSQGDSEREPANCPNRGHSPQIRLTAGDEVLELGWLCVSGAIPETVVVGEDLRAIWMRRRRRGEGGRRRSETEVKR